MISRNNKAIVKTEDNLSEEQIEIKNEIDRSFNLTLFILLLSPILVYLIILAIYSVVVTNSLFGFIQGSRDAWIGFAGSLIGGSMTMFAVIFTMQHDRKLRKQDYIHKVRPFLVFELVVKNNYIRELEFHDLDLLDSIDVSVRNVSENILKDFRIIEIKRRRQSNDSELLEIESDYDSQTIDTDGVIDIIASKESKPISLLFQHFELDKLTTHKSDHITLDISCKYTDAFDHRTYNQSLYIKICQYVYQNKDDPKYYYMYTREDLKNNIQK